MITDFLLNKFIGNNPNFSDPTIRKKVGYLGGVIGIVVNLILFIIKIIIGFILSSIAVKADAFNNLSDATSSIITILGFKLSSMPPDKEHPYGHGRIEYISALIVAFMVMFVGFQFVKSSVQKIIVPQKIVFQYTAFFILLISISLKIWLFIFNNKLADKINSNGLRATAMDAIGDVFTTSVVILSIFTSKFISFPIDGYIGLIVAFIIIYSGFSLVKDTIDPLIGEAPSKDLIQDIKNIILSYDYISGVHDLVVHNYGPGRTMATIHAEFPANVNIMDIHGIIDTAEKEVLNKLGVKLVIHMDPVAIDENYLVENSKLIKSIISDIDYIKSFHDFRIVGKDNKQVFIFDIIVDGYKVSKNTKDKDIKELLTLKIKEKKPNISVHISITRDYL